MAADARAVPSSIELMESGALTEVLQLGAGVERAMILRWRKTGGWVRQGGGRMAMFALGPLVLAGTMAIILERFNALLAIIGVGVALTLYAFIAAFVNATELRVSPKKLEVDHGPLPWLGNHRFTAQEVAQLYCEIVSPVKDGYDSSYRVMIILTSKRQVPLLPDLRDPSVALFIEEAVERTLGIRDEVVIGENILK